MLCFPEAGGRAQAFWPWAPQLQEEAEVWAYEMPGHGRRLHDRLVRRMDGIVEEVVMSTTAVLDGRPYALFGLGIGALIAFEAARALEEHAPAARLFVAERVMPDGPPIATSITCLAGTEDPLAGPGVMAQWQNLTSGAFVLRLLPGGYGVVGSRPDLALLAIREDLGIFDPAEGRHLDFGNRLAAS